jgi:uncharacterized protein YecT (DUF1311 family)
VRNKCIAALLCTLLLLGGCSGQPTPQPTAQPIFTTPPPAALPSPTASASDVLGGEYEHHHIDEVGATMLLPKSWAENYVAETEFSFADISNLEFWFGSGAGAWRTVLTVHNDGTFEGEYSDFDMGAVGTSYPNGICTLCRFTGKFTEPVKVDDYTYSVKLKKIELEKDPDTEEIKDGIKLIYSTPNGLDNADELLFYLPGAPVQELPEEYRSWAGGYGDSIDTELPFYGLFNVRAGQGFSSHKKATIDDELAFLEQEAASLENKLKTETLAQADMTETVSELYQMWDSKLNAIWSQLKEKMDAAAMEVLTAEELDWIAYKEAEMKKAGADVEGGTLQPMVEYGKGAELTRARVYELAAYLR